MRRIYKSMIWVSVLALSAGAVSAQKAERKNVREGNKLYESEKYTESEIAYRKSLEVNPRSTEGTYNLGNSLYKQGKFPEAAEQYQLIAGQGEKMVATPEGKARLSEVYHNMGNIFMQNKDYGKAVEVYKQSLRLNPKDDETRYNFALRPETAVGSAESGSEPRSTERRQAGEQGSEGRSAATATTTAARRPEAG